MIPRLKEKYDKTIINSLQKKLSMKNKLMVPRLKKVILNMGLGADANDKKKLQNLKNPYQILKQEKELQQVLKLH